MSLKKLFVTLGNDFGEETTIDFSIHTKKSAQIWASCLQKAIPSGFRENDRFDNFPQHPRGDLKNLIAAFEKVSLVLEDMHPELDFPKLDQSNLQQSINYLHHSFAHSHLVTNKINEKNKEAWQEYNTLLHAMEGAMSNAYYSNLGFLSLSSIIITFKDQQKVEIPEDCYKDFVLPKQFGTVYINYAQVGRHFQELYHSQDQHLDDSHIQPYRFIAADTYLWFGPTAGHFVEKDLWPKMKEWFEKYKERFNRLGFYWGDPKLAIGAIPVAQLSEPLYSIDEIKPFVENLSRFNKVTKVEVL